MVKILKNHLSLCALTTTMLFFVHNVNAKVEEVNSGGRANAANTTVQSNANDARLKNGEKSCDESSSFYKCSDGKKHVISNKTYEKTSSVSENIAIDVSKEHTDVRGDNITIKGSDVGAGGEEKERTWAIGVKALEKGEVFLENSTLKDVATGVDVSHGRVDIRNGSIDASKVGVLAHVEKDVAEKGIKGQSHIYLSNTNIKTGDKAIGLFSHGVDIIKDSKGNSPTVSDVSIIMNGGRIDFTGGVGVKTEGTGRVVLVGVSMSGKGSKEKGTEELGENSAFYMLKDKGSIYLKKSTVDVVDLHGIVLQARYSSAWLSESTVVVRGGEDVYGMRFLKNLEIGEKKVAISGGYTVDLTKTSFTVPNSTAVYNSRFRGFVNLSQGSKLSGDLLLKVDNSSSLMIIADDSTLVGGSRVDTNSIAELNLINNSKWILSKPQYQKVQDSDAIAVSSISTVSLSESSLVFEQPKSGMDDGYQTLRVGEGAEIVSRPYGEEHTYVKVRETAYSAEGNAHLYLNTYLNKGGDLKDQKTDRLLIHGDVAGKTTVHVQAVPGSPGGGTGSGGNNQGISLIQVSGQAQEDSFTLAGGYIALENLPYQYKLYAYGPTAHLGKADPGQRLVKGEGDFWDFRLENQYVDSDPKPTSESKPRPEVKLLPKPLEEADLDLPSKPIVRSVVPQVPTYLLLPNSLFHAGLIDINNQSKQLEALRTTSGGVSGVRENPALYLRGYGGSYRYASDLSALEYGYGGDVDYDGVEAGVLLHTVENVDSAVSFGVMGSYGKLSLQPQDVAQSQKSAFDKWTVAIYGNLQHDMGFYVNGLVSYGLFKGDVLTLARGKTATLEGHPLSVSLTGGQSFATDYKGLVVEPQAQVVYQHLQFNKARDIDNFDIEMGKLDQWVARVGGRLIKSPTGSKSANAVAFYGKLYLAHGFGERQSVHFKDAFQLGSFGSSLEAGLGFNAKIDSKFSLHGDVLYQHKLNKAGFSGASFSGGIRYQF
ncbi:autotransporter outer membrane beta-barrel domain-containing protein [Bartonella rattaustraliani]|uniref:autotransporter family protein n=1 Tax=Bartonella rattaustraliani TaxID=481139 RepID=UPI00036EE715|nr:autotransporter outer membrane beta-barrel domain-containing protein [Bartonella rattaustraliani]